MPLLPIHIYLGGALSITVIIIGNEIDKPNSNLGQSGLFPIPQMLLQKKKKKKINLSVLLPTMGK